MRQSGLFGTPAAMRLIGLLYLNPDAAYRLGDVLAAMKGTVERRATIYALNRLVADGFVEKREGGEAPRYRANPRCYVFDELKTIAAKTLGGFEDIAVELSEDDNIVAAAIYGSFAKGVQRADSDLDLLLIVQDPDGESAFHLLGRIESIGGRAGRQVNTTTYTEREVVQHSNAFLERVLTGPVLWLKGDAHAGASDAG
jgi:predicted nucleotidyltransferase